MNPLPGLDVPVVWGWEAWGYQAGESKDRKDDALERGQWVHKVRKQGPLGEETVTLKPKDLQQ